MSRTDFESEIIIMEEEEFRRFLMHQKLLNEQVNCEICESNLIICKYEKVSDGFAWHCLVSSCLAYKKKVSLRHGGFFEGFRLPLKLILRVLYRWSVNQSQESIVSSLNIIGRTYKKIILKFLDYVERHGNQDEKMGGPGKIVQVDETALNHGVKAHRGRAPTNKTDALCIIEYDTKITKAYACVIGDKKATTLLPIICDKVLPFSTIHTDEHKSYCGLNELGFNHDTVCHKRAFINFETGANTQAVESFNNEVKLEIKRRKGILTTKRSEFLKEFVWRFNHKESRFAKIWEMLKIKDL